ncbi:MAG TPA: GH32 C-terminal domain-containing protein, partial [Terriglobales bacterium]|nr:GH32 C-terminal domain-containing protein [Terriglobales bacterium]
ADEIGFKLRKGPNQETAVGVDAARSEVFVDRTQSGNISFAEHFAGRQSGPIAIGPGREVQLHIFLDRSSVEVFADEGSLVLSELVFPLIGDGIELYSKGGRGKVRRLDVWTLKSAYQ